MSHRIMLLRKKPEKVRGGAFWRLLAVSSGCLVQPRTGNSVNRTGPGNFSSGHLRSVTLTK